MNQYTGTIVSKNITCGEPITNLHDLARLTKERKSVIWACGELRVLPAAAVINWQLSTLLRVSLFYVIKTTHFNNHK